MLTKPAALADAIHSARIVLMTINRPTQPTSSPQPSAHTLVNYADGFMAGIKAATILMQQPTSSLHNFHQLHQPAPAPTCTPVSMPFNAQPQHSASCNACHAHCHLNSLPSNATGKRHHQQWELLATRATTIYSKRWAM